MPSSNRPPMKRRQREAILVALAKRMRKHHSWCGETHIQKATYVLEELLGVPLDFGHVLYKFGPFAYDLRDELATMRADGFLDVEAVSGFGPRLAPTAAADRQLLAKWPQTLGRYEKQLDFVAKHFGSKGVGELERLATALWVQKEAPHANQQQQARRLHQIKPHVSIESASDALEMINRWRDEATRLKTPRRARRSVNSSDSAAVSASGKS